MKITMKCYIDCGYAFGESLNLAESHPRPISVRLDQIATARQAMLAPNVSILRLDADGIPRRHVDMPGTGGGFARLLKRLNLCSTGCSSDKIFLRGFPSEMIVGFRQLTPAGTMALVNYSRALRENGVFLVHDDQQRPIEHLMMTSWTTLTKSHLGNRGNPTKLGTLQDEFGMERGQKLWDERKAGEAARQQPLVKLTT
jgi:hypothetical protein